MVGAVSTEVDREAPSRIRKYMSDDDKKKVNIGDLPVPLKELDKEEQENVIGGVGDVSTISPTPDPGSNAQVVWIKSQIKQVFPTG